MARQLADVRGHPTLTVVRKGGKTATLPLAPRTSRAINLAIGERRTGPIFVNRAGHRLDRHGAARIVERLARAAGITAHITPHTLRHAFITAALDAGVPLHDLQEAASQRPVHDADPTSAGLRRRGEVPQLRAVAGPAPLLRLD